ncbi:MAG: hypothetical protein Q8O99_04795 [bacterium]|nr:hypothetical protein [bacterium]
MFSEKRLIVLRGIPQDTIAHNKVSTKTVGIVTGLLMSTLSSLTDDTIVICISYKPDKRLKGYKRFVNNATVKEFPLVDDKQKNIYIEQRCPGLLDATQKELLVSIAGDTLFHLRNECKKLSDRAEYHHISKLATEDIEAVTVGIATMNVFTILDHLYTTPTKAIQLITQAQGNGQDMFQFLGMLYRGLELSLGVENLHAHGINEGKQITSLLKAHPFAVSKQLKLVTTLHEKKESIIRLYTNLLQIDADIKTGVLPQEGFRIALKCAIQNYR